MIWRMCECVFTKVQMCMVVCDTVCGSSGKGYFMHFSTTSAQPADRASLESQWLYSKPGTHCLQFFLHQSGASDDILNIWVRDYDQAHPGGKLTLIQSITGMRDDTVPVLTPTLTAFHNSFEYIFIDCPDL